MDAQNYLKTHGRAAAEKVAQLAGTKYIYLCQIASGHRKPSPKLAKALVRASGGEMTLESLRPDIFGDVHA